MNVEIKKIANGYLVLPIRYFRDTSAVHDTDIYVFESYSKMMDKLQEILERPEPK
jgi:hypothetical protein